MTFPDFGVGVTQGDDREEAMAQAADLLETMVANYMAEGWDLPEPSPALGRPLVRLAPLVPGLCGYSKLRREEVSIDEGGGEGTDPGHR